MVSLENEVISNCSSFIFKIAVPNICRLLLGGWGPRFKIFWTSQNDCIWMNYTFLNLRYFCWNLNFSSSLTLISYYWRNISLVHTCLKNLVQIQVLTHALVFALQFVECFLSTLLMWAEVSVEHLGSGWCHFYSAMSLQDSHLIYNNKLL